MQSPFYHAPIVKEKLDERLLVMAPRSMSDALDKEAAASGETRSDVVRRAIEQYYAPKVTITADTGADSLCLPSINSIPCGPLSEAYAEAGEFTVNAQTALELELIEGDYWTRSDGSSMLAAGIADGVRVAVRPYGDKAPRRGEIVIVQIETADGARLGTIKEYDGHDECGRPRFIDGEKTPYPLPDDCQFVEMPARVISTMGRLA